jgi:hypothetical protein
LEAAACASDTPLGGYGMQNQEQQMHENASMSKMVLAVELEDTLCSRVESQSDCKLYPSIWRP